MTKFEFINSIQYRKTNKKNTDGEYIYEYWMVKQRDISAKNNEEFEEKLVDMINDLFSNHEFYEDEKCDCPNCCEKDDDCEYCEECGEKIIDEDDDNDDYLKN